MTLVLTTPVQRALDRYRKALADYEAGGTLLVTRRWEAMDDARTVLARVLDREERKAHKPRRKP